MNIPCAARESVLRHVFGLTLRHINPPSASLVRKRQIHSQPAEYHSDQLVLPTRRVKAVRQVERPSLDGDYTEWREIEAVAESSTSALHPSSPVQAIPVIYSDVDKITSLHPDKRHRIANRLTKYLAKFHPLPLSPHDLLQHANDLKTIVRHLTPTKLTQAEPPDVRNLLIAWGGLLRAVERLHSTQLLPPSFLKSKDFDSILLILSRLPPSTALGTIHDRWSNLTFPLVLDFLTTTLSLRPTNAQLQVLVRHQSASPIISVAHSTRNRIPRVITSHFVQVTILPVWDRRRDLLTSVEQFGGDENGALDGHIGECINLCLEEADIIGGGPFPKSMVSKLVSEVAFWSRKRDEMVKTANNSLKSLFDDWQSLSATTEKPDNMTKADISIGRDDIRLIMFLLRDSLLKAKLRGRTQVDVLPGSFRYNDPLELVRLLASASTTPTTPSSHPDRLFTQAIWITRNSFYRQRQFASLLSLVSLLSELPSSTPHPSPTTHLSGNAYASILTAARDRRELCRLMVRLYHCHLPVSSPASLDRGTRRMLHYLAHEADMRAGDVDLHPPADEPREVVGIVKYAGWQGLLWHLYARWGVGLPKSQWDQMGAARQNGDVEEVKRLQEQNEARYRISELFPQTLNQVRPGKHLNQKSPERFEGRRR